MAKVSDNLIEDINTDWGLDPKTGLPFSGAAVQRYIKEAGISPAQNAINNRWGAAYFDPQSYRWLGFKDDEDKAEYIATGDESLIVGSPVPFSFSGTVSQIKVINEMSSANLYFTTKAEEALITCSFISQEKGLTDSAWEEVNEDFLVSVAIDRGNTGEFTPIITDQLVLNGNKLIFDVRKGLATGNNRVRVIVKGVLSEATSSFTYQVNLTSMYLSPSNFTWYTPFIEGATYNLGGVMIGGNLQKVLKIKVAKEGYEKIYEVNIGSATYITNAYTFTGLEFPDAGTGIYNVELWLDANGLESEHLKYNIICVAAADQYTARLISVSEQPDKVFNFAENSLFKYAIYNAGAAMGTPHVKVSSIVKNTPTVLVDEDLADVPTGSPLDYTVSIEIETEEVDVQLDAVITFGNEQQTIYAVDNSKSFPATSGAVFYINPAIRSNAQENKDKIVNAIDAKVYDAVFERMAWTDGTDGWTTDNAGRKCLRLPASSTCTIPYQPFAKMSGSKTIEITYKVENAADYTEPIITICDDPTSADFRGIKITPKEIAIHSRDLKDTELQNYKPTDEETLNVIISIVPNYKTNYGNLVKVWCNGSPVREFSFESNDSWLQSGNIILGSQTADFYLYKMRVYELAFGAPNAMQNFVNSLPTAEDKANAQAQIDKAINDSYQLDYDACVKAGLNTMVIEMLGDGVIPNLLNPSSGQCNLWINILNKIDGELDEEMSALLSNMSILNQTIEGQGTTAMTYFRWNFRWKLGSAYGKRRITAKKNVASSMQSHKMGATRMFNHLHRAVVGENIVEKDVAVSQYPVFGFQKVKIEGTTDQYNYVPIGLYTIGADKGDKPTFGFDDERYESTLMHLEGTDHTPMAVGMDYPWSATRYDASKEAMGAIGNTGDVVAAWEVGAAGEFEPDATADQANVQAMLDAEFKPAYDVAYYNSPYILGVTETLAQINADVAAWRRRTTVDGKSYSLYEFYTIGTYDVYYYNTQSQRYEANGINLLTDLGLSSGVTNEDIIAARKVRFKSTWGNYWNTDDSIFHYTFCMIFAATDNYKKNTYPYKFRPLADGGRWAWRADDLDTLFDINNQGLAAKVYSVLVGDQTSTGSGSIYRGDTSAFWTLIKETCQDEIKAMVHRIFNAMVSMSPYGNNTLEKLVGCVRRFFWDYAQNYFSAAAYNNDTEWTYEDTWATAGAWKEVNPLSQALGGHHEAERDWVTMRVLFLASYYNYGPFGTVNDSFSDTSTGQLVYGGAGQHTFEITPAIDFNPTILRGQSELVTVGDRVKAGETVDLTVPDSSGADTRIYVQGADWFKSIGDLSQLQVSADNPSLSVASKRMQSLKVGDEVADNVTSNLKTLNMGANPSMMVVDARNLTSLTGTVDLTQLPRLREALFGGTNVRSLGVASGSKVEHLQFGDGTTALTLQNLKFLETLEIGDKSKIEFFRVENCEGFNPFDLLKTAYNLDSQALKDIRIIGFVYDGDSTDADMLANLANDLDKDGNEHAYNGINSEGTPMPDAHPVIEGTLNIAGSVYEDAANDIRANYPNLTLIIEGGYYIRFADPVVQEICATNWGDGAGTGITKEQVAEVTTFGTHFQGRTDIYSFDEARMFTNLTTFRSNGFKDSTLTHLNMSGLQGVTGTMTSAFAGMQELTSLVLDGFSTKKVTSLNNVFQGLSKITRIDISSWNDTSSVTGYTYYLFDGDYLLEEVNLPENFLPATLGYGQFMWYNSNYAIKKFTGWFNVQNAKSYPDFQGAPQLRQMELRNIGGNPEATSLNYSVRVRNWGVNSEEVLYAQQSLINTFNHLYDRASAGYSAFTITLSADSLASLEEGMGDVGMWNVLQKGYTIANYSPYITFEDPIVASICATNWGDGTNIAKGQAAAVTTFNNKFKGNTAMQSFEEARYFTGLTSLGESQFQGNTALTKVSFRDARLSGSAFDMINTFRDCSQLSEIDMTNMFVDEQVVSMYYTFRGTAITNFKFPKMTYKHKIVGGTSGCLFFNCANLESLDMSDLTMDFTLGKPASPNNNTWGCKSMCENCSSLASFVWPKEKIVGLITLRSAFKGCISLENIASPNIDTSTIQLLGGYNEGMFYGCTLLKSFDLSWLNDTTQLVDMTHLFMNCSSLTSVTGLGDIAASPNGVDLYGMFVNCTSMTEVDLGNITYTIDLSRIVSGCSSLQRIVLPKKIKAWHEYPFMNCNNLTTIESKVPVDVSEVTNFSNVFGYYSAAVHLPEFVGINATWNVSNCKNLTHQSLMNLINGLADRTGQTALTLTLGSTNLAKLTDEDKAIATAKNWTLA